MEEYNSSTFVNGSEVGRTLYGYSGVDLIRIAMIFVGFVCELAVMAVFIRYRNTEFKTPYYIIARSMSVAEFALQIKMGIDLLWGIGWYVGWAGLTRVQGWYQVMCWYLIQSHQLLIAIDRLLATTVPIQYKILATRRRAVVGICVAWVWATLLVFPMLTPKYGFIVNPGGFVYFNLTDPDAAQYYQTRDWLIQPCVLGIIILFYGISTMAVIRQKMTVTTLGAQHSLAIEVKLMIQGILVTVPMIVVVIMFYVQIYHAQSIGLGAMSIMSQAVDVLYVLIFTINPIIYISFSSTVRSHMGKLYCSKAAVVDTAPLSMHLLSSTNNALANNNFLAPVSAHHN